MFIDYFMVTPQFSCNLRDVQHVLCDGDDVVVKFRENRSNIRLSGLAAQGVREWMEVCKPRILNRLVDQGDLQVQQTTDREHSESSS